MTVPRSPLRWHRFPVVGGVAVLLLFASGCATETTAAETPAPSADTTAANAPQATDEETCTAFGDVITIMNNAQAAAAGGRMGDPELQGWLRLATRVQDRIPSTGEGPISDALTALRSAAPAIPPGSTETPGILSDAWMTAGTEFHDACEAAGYEYYSEGFVGG